MVFLKWLALILMALVLGSVGVYLMQPSMDEVGIDYESPYQGSYEKKSGDRASVVTVKWFGVSTLLIDDGETQLLIDGYFSRPGLLDVALKRPISPELDTIARVVDRFGMERVAAVMPVHSHFDHALDSGEVAKFTGALLLGSQSTANIGRSAKLPESQIGIVDVDKIYNFGQFKVTFYASEHAPLGSNSGIDGVISEPFEIPADYTAWQLGQAYSIVIEHPSGVMLVEGSAGFVAGALGDLAVDAVFLGVGGLRDLARDYQQEYIYEKVVKTNPNNVYIIHHDDMFDTLGKVDQSKLMLSFDSTFAFELQQLVLPANLKQLRYGEAISISR
jgi:L-ascorbate metabolism protein UlaG (beta-lactamase superfamily)